MTRRSLAIFLSAVIATTFVANVAAAPAKKALRHSAPPHALPTLEDFTKCAGLTSAVKVAELDHLDLTKISPYPDRYSTKIVLDIIDHDPSMKNAEDRGFVLDRLSGGGRARSESVDKAVYLISHEEGQAVLAYRGDISKLNTAINYCKSKNIDPSVDIDLTAELSKSNTSIGSYAADYQGVNYNDVCGQSKSLQRNSFVAGLPADYCEKMRPGGAGVSQNGSSAPIRSNYGQPYPSPGSNTASIDPTIDRLTCSQIVIELSQISWRTCKRPFWAVYKLEQRRPHRKRGWTYGRMYLFRTAD